jgi:hypothetical protein
MAKKKINGKRIDIAWELIQKRGKVVYAAQLDYPAVMLLH